ncbi:hypothetical protein CARUB_v10003811mg [Capsella rubella]|uniref:Uncharacterized protein n=1 Tax=Capsella rubella TaxID=81985 RepID=R0HGY9_9BRAS|nr:hypothetical protein CARUB_v10003811mg [Capsella rubella]
MKIPIGASEKYADNVRQQLFQIDNNNNVEMSKYLEYSKYLPKLNNERPNKRNPIFKDRFTSLHNLVLVMVLLFLKQPEDVQHSF